MIEGRAIAASDILLGRLQGRDVAGHFFLLCAKLLNAFLHHGEIFTMELSCSCLRPQA